MKIQFPLIGLAVIGTIVGCTRPDRPPDSLEVFKPVLVAEEQPTNVTRLLTPEEEQLVEAELEKYRQSRQAKTP